MNDDKFLHVGCIVKQANVYDLLRALEAHRVGNVEVRAVAPPLLLPPPNKQRKQGKLRKQRRGKGIRPAVAAAMPIKEKRRVKEIAEQINANVKSVYSAISHLILIGVVKRTAPGVFVRVKDFA
jgi:hypothetical protein